MKQRYAIFDMDGTLVDSMGYWQHLEREFLESKGVTGEMDSILERTAPLTLLEAAALFSQYCNLEGTPQQLADEIMAIMARHYRTDVALKPGAAECLDRLSAQGVRMCVASATPAHLVRLCLERLGLAHHFEFLLSCVDVGAGKRQPDVFFEAARRLGARPGECAVFEDSIYAVRTAHGAGFHVVAVQDSPQNDGSWAEMCALAQERIVNWDDYN